MCGMLRSTKRQQQLAGLVTKDTFETMVPRFWDCPKAKAAWEWAFTIIHNLSNPLQKRGRKKGFDAKQFLFTKKLPKAYRQFSYIWTLVRSLVLWAIQLDMNDKIFNNVQWSDGKLGCTNWEGLIDCGRLHQNIIKLEIDKAPCYTKFELLTQFVVLTL